MDKLSIAIAGSTHYTALCAESLLKDGRFEIPWLLTPVPKKIGRKQILTKNPLHEFALKNDIPVILIEGKIAQVKAAILEKHDQKKVDFLLVVDFGYIVPNWLLDIPQVAPLNIHPSELPKYRGSSPGQFALLYGEKTSAVSVIKMNSLLDQGDLIYQEKFGVSSNWNSQDYYDFAFALIAKQLPNIVTGLYAGKITPQPQTLETPTPIANRFTREDGFVSWELLNGKFPNGPAASDFLIQVNQKLQNWPQTISNAVRALSPWPGVWTVVHTEQGEKRMKIHSVSVENGELRLEKVQIEGQTTTNFSEKLIQLSYSEW
jgi:methionyl-tRNA formyltransferase